MAKRKTHWSDVLKGIACGYWRKRVRKHRTIRQAWKNLDLCGLDGAYCILHGFRTAEPKTKLQEQQDRVAYRITGERFGDADSVRARLVKCPTLAQLTKATDSIRRRDAREKKAGI